MVLEGLTGLPGRGQELISDVKQAGQETVRVLAACQALIHVDGKFVGDPLEKASFTATGASCYTCIQGLGDIFAMSGNSAGHVDIASFLDVAHEASDCKSLTYLL